MCWACGLRTGRRWDVDGEEVSGRLGLGVAHYIGRALERPRRRPPDGAPGLVRALAHGPSGVSWSGSRVSPLWRGSRAVRGGVLRVEADGRLEFGRRVGRALVEAARDPLM